MSENSYTEKSENAYTVKLEKFEGPLDLLLYLIEKSEIDIYDIPISEITEQYLKYLNLMRKVDINISSEFILMASTLMLIKSKMLIPVEVDFEDEAFEDPRKELVEQLLEYQKFKNAALELEERGKLTENLFFRDSNQMLIDFQDTENWVDVKLFDLIEIFSKFIKKINMEEMAFIIPERVTVGMKIEEIKNMVDIQNEFILQDLFSSETSIWEIVVTFLAMLELIKQHYIIVKQHKLFGEIKIIKRI